ncbi:flagellar hook assembly protein FlgD [Rhodobacterales bacterium]|nr:flagellar hook assembly protein FlgD [Rhodobacterales bacterium]
MTTVNSASGAGAGASASAFSQTSLMGNYDLFLSILTTQIQNQDPLDPMDSSEYTSQLVEYSSVEQSIQQNKNLESIIGMLQSSHMMSYVNYLGREVTMDGTSAVLSDGVASWDYEVPKAASGTVSVLGSDGTVVFSEDIDLAAGENTYNWNGVMDNGKTAEGGTYLIAFNVKGQNDKPVQVSTATTGVVEGVDWSSGKMFLTVDGKSVPASKITSVSQAAG